MSHNQPLRYHLQQHAQKRCFGRSAWILTLVAMAMGGCASFSGEAKLGAGSVSLPYLRLEAAECYYVDDFMPTPDSLVTGKNGGLSLRYYTYKTATYKNWADKSLMLAFYSRDNRCWSLFDEYTISTFF